MEGEAARSSKSASVRRMRSCLRPPWLLCDLLETRLKAVGFDVRLGESADRAVLRRELDGVGEHVNFGRR